LQRIGNVYECRPFLGVVDWFLRSYTLNGRLKSGINHELQNVRILSTIMNMKKYLFRISFCLLINVNALLAQNINIDKNGNVVINNIACRLSMPLQDFNTVLKTEHSKSKFDKLGGEKYGSQLFYYQNLGLLAYSSLTKKKYRKYFIQEVDIIFLYDNLYKKGSLFGGLLTIDGYTIKPNSSFDELNNNEILRKYIDASHDIHRTTKTILELRIENRQVIFTFSDNDGSKISSISFILH
jgi:hypothetical protein